jgi:hypothetical protein
MRAKFRTTFATAAAAALVLGSAGLAVADSLDLTGDELTGPAVVDLGDVCVGESASGSIKATLQRSGSGQVFANGTTVTISAEARGGAQLETTSVGPLTDWVTYKENGQIDVAADNGKSYDTTPRVTVNVPEATAVGAKSATLAVQTSGAMAAGSNPPTAPLNVSWTVIDCAPSDTTAPEISYTVDPADPNGDNGWYTGDVTVKWHVSDESGIAEDSDCKDEDVDTLDYDTTGETFSCTATDIHGNTDTVTTGSIKRDAAEPTITWDAGSPADGASYYFGDAIPTADCTADDATSGVNADGCQVTGGGTAVGEHTLTAKATDNAGNETIETRTYTVLAWTMDGFYRPVDMGKVNTVKAGSTVPLKFNVFKGDERLTSGIGATFSAKKVSCTTGEPTDAIEEFTTTGKTELRYDADGQQWVQNWATPKSGGGSCYLVTMTTADGTSITAEFKLK